MTDTRRLEELAGKISKQSPAIRTWALEQLRVTKEQETRLRKLEAPPSMVLPPFSPAATVLTLNRVGNQVMAITNALNGAG